MATVFPERAGRLSAVGPWRVVQAVAVLAVLAAGVFWQDRAGERSAAVPPPRTIGEYYFVPVRVHLFRAPESPAVDTTLTKTDIERIFRKANGIWHAAGIHLWPESVVEEKPPSIEDPHAAALDTSAELRSLRPQASRADGMFHVYYVGRMGVNGLFMSRDAVFVQQNAALRVVEGGIDEPLPRVTSHEIGHGLGLSHRQDRTNLMASGTTGTSLNEEEIATSRKSCGDTKWITTTELFLDRLDALTKSGKAKQAESGYRAVAELPGESPLKERAKRGLAVTEKAS